MRQLQNIQTIKLDSGFSQAYNSRGLAYMRQRQFDLAINDFSVAIALKPESAGLYINRSSIYNLKKEFDKSLADLERAIEIDPKFAEAYSARGHTYRQMKEFNKAVENFSKAIEIKQYSTFYSGRCMAYFDLGKFENAISDCSEGISLNPKDTNALYYRGLSRVKLEQNALAISDFRKVLDINANNIGAKTELEKLLKNTKY